MKNVYHNAQSIGNRAYVTLYNLPILPGVYSLVKTSVPVLNWQFHLHAQRRSEEGHRGQCLTDSAPQCHRDRARNCCIEITFSIRAFRAKDGFYRKLDALQGHRGTDYTGAALTAHESHLIWGFSEKLLLKHFV